MPDKISTLTSALTLVPNQASTDAPPVVPMVVACADCGIRRTVNPTKLGHPRTPGGWKNVPAGLYCKDCWRKRYVLRSVCVPIAGPMEGTWEQLMTQLHAMWKQTTSLSNWIMTQLWARDFRRLPDSEKLPPPIGVYLYPEATVLFPGLPTQCIAALEQSVKLKYNAKRRDVLWRCSATLPTHRYPTPFPMPSQAWHLTIENDQTIVSVRIGDARWRLRLKRGPQFYRQMLAIRLIASGQALPGELAIYQHSNVMVKLAAWLPRTAAAQIDETDLLAVHTDPECLLVAVNPKDEVLWRYNGDHLRRWAVEHRKTLQRWGEDQKYEQRPVPNFDQRRKAAARKYNYRMESATHEIAQQLASYAKRRKFGGVRYDDSVQTYVGDGFPWYRLRLLLQEKLDAYGLRFELAEPPLVPPEDLSVFAEVQAHNAKRELERAKKKK